MSFNPNDTITLNNYEEHFMLYVDEELSASQKEAVEAFVVQHPQLAEELVTLMSAKLPLDELVFGDKAALLSPSMKTAGVDEALLLFIDDELPSAERAAVAQRIETDDAYALQHSALLQIKLDAGDVVAYPDKKELYRHERRATPLLFWMRMAAAVILLLIGTWFFVLNKDRQSSGDVAAKQQPVNNKPGANNQPTVMEQVLQKAPVQKEAVASTKATPVKPLQKDSQSLKQKMQNDYQNDVASANENATANHRKGVLRIEAKNLATAQSINPSIPDNKTIAFTPVTISKDDSYKNQNNAGNNPEVAWTVDEKKTPARGFFRKVSRFIERKTGIATANADDELLVGAVALKLK